MTLTKNYFTLEFAKTVALYTVLFFALAFGNYFRNDFIAFAWMFSLSLFVGYLHKLREMQGIIGFVVPAILLFAYALQANFQYVFIAECLFTLGGFYIGSQWFKSKQAILLSTAIAVLLLSLILQYIATPLL